MPNIKNFELITAKVKDFAVSDLKFVTDFRYWVEMDTVNLYDPYNIPMLLISFVLIPGGIADF